MKLKRSLFDPCSVDKVSNIGWLSQGIHRCPSEGIENTYHPQDMGWKGSVTCSLLWVLFSSIWRKIIVAEDGQARRPRSRALDVHSTRTWRTKLHYLLADTVSRCIVLTPHEHLLPARNGQGHSRRSLPDIGLSTTANDGRASALFSATKNPHRIPVNTPPVFRGLRSRIYLPLLRLVTNGNVGEAPGQLNNPSGARSWRVSLTRVRLGLKMVLCVHSQQPRHSACPSSWWESPSRSVVSQLPQRQRHHRSIGAPIKRPIGNIQRNKSLGACRLLKKRKP